MTLAQVIMVGLVWKRDASPRNFERARSPSERAGIEDGRNRNFRGYLGDRETSLLRSIEFVLPRLTTCHGQLPLAQSRLESEARQLEPSFRRRPCVMM
jgi:hypothetical protein